MFFSIIMTATGILVGYSLVVSAKQNWEEIDRELRELEEKEK